LPLFKSYLSTNLTAYALARVKYLTAKGFKWFTVTKKDGKAGLPVGKTYLVERKDSVAKSSNSEE